MKKSKEKETNLSEKESNMRNMFKFNLDLEIVLPLVDLWVSLVFAAIMGPNNIDL